MSAASATSLTLTFPRSEHTQRESATGQELIFHPDAPQPLLDMFTAGPDQAAH
ncbi:MULTISPECIES: hypothetical protein [Streptomyces]